MSRCFVIAGGGGFIGQALACRLEASGARVILLDKTAAGRPHGEWGGDLANPVALARAMRRADGCFHLARNTGEILHAANSAGGVPVVFTSSAAVYGHQPDRPIPESASASPVNAYGAMKLAGEQAAQVAFRQYGLPSLSLRFFNVYGPGRDPTAMLAGVIARFMALLAVGAPLPVRGDGLQKRDFLHLDDAVNILDCGMIWLQSVGGMAVLNACSGEAVSVRELLAQFAANLGVHPLVLRAPADPLDVKYSYGDTTALRHTLKLTPGIGLAAGLLNVWQRDYGRDVRRAGLYSDSHYTMCGRPVGFK